MSPEILEAIGPLFGITAVGILVLIGMRMRYKYKIDSMQRPSSEQANRLTEAVDGLYEQAQALREEVNELQERLDFHERLLTKAKQEREQADTPA
ncbi:MAG: hypothetical protein JSW51_07465 [Gemmatimonadota bacterium]|nr:MAG: hypothetical protein JSW51_07465 [Gemmatimonadota bacterium]